MQMGTMYLNPIEVNLDLKTGDIVRKRPAIKEPYYSRALELARVLRSPVMEGKFSMVCWQHVPMTFRERFETVVGIRSRKLKHYAETPADVYRPGARFCIAGLTQALNAHGKDREISDGVGTLNAFRFACDWLGLNEKEGKAFFIVPQHLTRFGAAWSLEQYAETGKIVT